MAKKSSRHVFIILAVALLISILLVTVIALNPLPRLIWNASKSVPIGFYWIEKRSPHVGEIAALKPPEWVQLIADERHYLPNFAWLLKPVVATNGAIICRFGRMIFDNGKLVARAHLQDELGRNLPTWKGCKVLRSSQVFLLSKHHDSLDGRYFGPINRNAIMGTAVRITFN